MAQMRSHLMSTQYEVFLEEIETDVGLVPQLTLFLKWDQEQVSKDTLIRDFSDNIRVSPTMTYSEGEKKYAYKPLKVEPLIHSDLSKQKGIQRK